ncbi:MAG: histidine kinase dimerization/phosphoacceptor domain -containing protein [Ignavibacteriaceae bacterium]
MRTFLFLWGIIFLILSLTVFYTQIFSTQKNAEYAIQSANKTTSLYSFYLSNALDNKEQDMIEKNISHLLINDDLALLIKISSADDKFSYTWVNKKQNERIKKYNLESFLNDNREQNGISSEKKVVYTRQPFYNKADTSGWISAVFASEDYYMPVESLLSKVLYSFFISLLVSIVVTLVLSCKILLPLRKLHNASEEIARGEAFDNLKLLKGKEFILLGNSIQGITEAFRDTKQELLKSRSYIENIIQSINSSLIVLDPERKIKFVNKSTVELLGYSEEELTGMHISNILEEDESRGISIDHLIEMNQLKNTPADLIRKDKETVSVSFSGSVIYNHKNEIQDIICLGNDITERKEAEAAIIRAHDELEIRVAERTFELEEMNKALKAENKERLDTERKLVSSLEEKEVLLKEIHHRVKNNLQIISSLLQLNSMKIKDKDSLEIFKASQMRIKSIAMVHERLYQTKDLGSIDIRDYVNVLTKDLFTLFGSRGASIELKTDICDIHLCIDKTISLGLILNEMVTNSIKYAFPEQRPGEISIIMTKAEDDKYLLTYKDNGIGLPPGLNILEVNSLGMRLIRNLTKQIDGTMEIKNGVGVEYNICFSPQS